MSPADDLSQVLVLVSDAGDMYLISRKSFAQAFVDTRPAAGSAPLLRATGMLDPSFPISSLGIRTVLGLPAPVMAVPGIMDDGESQAAVDLNGAYALLSRSMLDNVRIRQSDHQRVSAALVPRTGAA